MSGTAYIPRGGEQVYSPPFVAEGVQFFGFVVAADKAKLQDICDRYLNGPSGTGDFAPLLPYVMFVFNKLARMYAKDPPDQDRGWYTEQEGAVWMPVFDKKRLKALWYHPYMVVDSSYAMAMGREIYGFPKEIGWFDAPDGPEPPESMHVETVVVKTLDPACQAVRGQLFEARICDGGRSSSVPPYEQFGDLGELAKAMGDRLGFVAHLGIELFQNVITAPIPMVFLKQFRDAVDPSRACFQSVQEATTEMTRLHNLRVYLHSYEIAFEDWASHPLRADLGLDAGAAPVKFAFWALFDFEIGACTEISRA